MDKRSPHKSLEVVGGEKLNTAFLSTHPPTTLGDFCMKQTVAYMKVVSGTHHKQGEDGIVGMYVNSGSGLRLNDLIREEERRHNCKFKIISKETVIKD